MHIYCGLRNSSTLPALCWLNWSLSLWCLLLLLEYRLIQHLSRHWLNRLSSIQSGNLFFEVIIFHSKKLYLPFQVEDNLLFGIHLQNWLVLNIHCSCSVIQSGNSFIYICFWWRDTCNHESFRGSTKTVLEKHGKFGISEGNILMIDLGGIFLWWKHRYDLTKSEKTLIDLTCFLCHYSLWLRFFESLTTCKINERNLTIFLIHMIIFFTFCFTDQIHCQNWMRSWRIFVELMTSLMSVLDTLMEHCNKILNTGALYHH